MWRRWGRWGRQDTWTGGGESAPAVFTVSGSVTDWEGAALSGVLLTLTGGYTATTDGTGAYTIANVPAGSYTLTPTKTGVTFNPVSAAVTVSTANVTGEDFQEQVWVVDGTITDWAGANLSGVLVSVTGDKTSSDTTVANGTYGLALPDGSYTLTPTKAGVTFNPASTAVVVSGASQLGKDFAEQVYAVSGNVVDAASAAISGATITITGDKSTSTSTDGSGDYSINLPNGSYTVTPTKAGYDFTPASTAVTVAGSAQTGKDFAEATYSISGDIVDGADAGIEGVLVTLSGDASDTDTTDSNGAYSFAGLPDGSYTVTPTLTDYTFVETHEDVTVAGDDVVVDDMVGTSSILSLPFTLDWEDGVLPTYGGGTLYTAITTEAVLGSIIDSPSVGGWDASSLGFDKMLVLGPNISGANDPKWVNYTLSAGVRASAGFRIATLAKVNSGSGGWHHPGIGLFSADGNYGYRWREEGGGGFIRYYLCPTVAGVETGFSTQLNSQTWAADNWGMGYKFIGLEFPAAGSGNIVTRYIHPDPVPFSTQNSNAINLDVSGWPLLTRLRFEAHDRYHTDTFAFAFVWIGSLTDAWPL